LANEQEINNPIQTDKALWKVINGTKFSELAREHRKHDLIRFVSTTAEGVAWLQG